MKIVLVICLVFLSGCVTATPDNFCRTTAIKISTGMIVDITICCSKEGDCKRI